MIKLYLPAIVLVAVLLAIGLWLGADFFDARNGAQEAAAELIACRDIQQRIESLKARQVRPGADGLNQAALQRRVQSSLQAIGVPATHLLQVAPEQPRTIGDTAYREMPTNLVFQGITLHQVIEFLLTVANDGSPLQAHSLRLSAPHENDEAGDVDWTAEVTLTYMIHRKTVRADITSFDGRGDDQ